MKKHLFYFAILFIITLLSSCKTSKVGDNNINNDNTTNNKTDSKTQVIVGKWQETWDNAKNSSDIYSLKIVGERLTISCATHKYEFQNISYQNNLLRFKLLNTDKYVGETYIIDYELTFQAEKNIFEGKAKTNKGVTAKILWQKF
jgi:hypothetical protein